ncbi:MAG: ATP-grasp domain-containing protein [Planctomycetes bacterium]|nr:ATP-grasp domain-containing protein [Planctomycetota bacterium]
MRIFVSEYVSSGALAGTPLPDSLLREGTAMLVAVSADLTAMPGQSVTTTLDRRLADSVPMRNLESIEFDSIDDAAAEAMAFEQRVRAADATLVIAPETDGVLAARVRRVLDLGGRSLNCQPSAIELCGDKLLLAGHLTSHDIPTIPTRPLLAGTAQTEMASGAWVIKPRDGAGSWLTFGIRAGDSHACDRALAEFAAAGAMDRAIVQPWMDGQALSVGCLCDGDGMVEILPVGQQDLSGDRFEYQGGQIPADISGEARSKIDTLVRAACKAVPGLYGYVGIDLLVPHRESLVPLIVEINPRLTTSYVGYRELCLDNLARQMLWRCGLESNGSPSAVLGWKPKSVYFQANGNLRI